jgi:hypothetical protein
VRRGALLAPNMYITGQILNGEQMGFCARVVTTPEAGREAVREDKAAKFELCLLVFPPEAHSM